MSFLLLYIKDISQSWTFIYPLSRKWLADKLLEVCTSSDVNIIPTILPLPMGVCLHLLCHEGQALRRSSLLSYSNSTAKAYLKVQQSIVYAEALLYVL